MSKFKELMMNPWGYGIDVRVYFNNVKDCMYHTAFIRGAVSHNQLKRLINLAGSDHPEGIPTKEPEYAELYIYRMYGDNKEYQQFSKTIKMNKEQCKQVWSYE
jgi:hypothetical protein